MEMRSRGRPKIVWDEKQVQLFKSLCHIQCTQAEICEIMAIDNETLVDIINRQLYADVTGKQKNQFSERLDFSAAYKKYSAAGRMSLRRKLFDKAVQGSTPELIFLAKNQLGMSDNPNGTTETVQVTIVDGYSNS